MEEAMDPVILASVRNGIGHITLNRPKALNSLSSPMVRELDW
jgi:enoyl-CoA hydratase/carnithine racemase